MEVGVQHVNRVSTLVGRGYVALRDIPAGTLILAEEPFIDWPEDTEDMPLHVAVVKGIVTHENASEVRVVKLNQPKT